MIIYLKGHLMELRAPLKFLYFVQITSQHTKELYYILNASRFMATTE